MTLHLLLHPFHNYSAGGDARVLSWIGEPGSCCQLPYDLEL